MGWSGGSAILGAVVDYAHKRLSCVHRRGLYTALIRALEEGDADTLGECKGEDPVLDALLLKLGHTYDEEEEEEDE